MRRRSPLARGARIAACLAFGVPTIVAATEASPSLEAFRIDDTDAIVTLDGRFDEPFWDAAAVAADFVQREPQAGEPASERTEVRVAYNDRTLYVAVQAFDDHPESIIAREMKRDGRLAADDSVILLLDTFDDDRNAYFFETNPLGARTDALISDEGRDFNFEWDGVWDVTARRTIDGWVAEIAIPFSTLRFNPDTTRWGFNVRRLIRHKNEEAFWAPVGLDGGIDRVSRYGALTGLAEASPGLGLSVKPFVVAKTIDAEPSSDLESGEEVEVGLDVKWAVTRGLSLDATVNTDFAETEVDDQRVNITRFSLFFPEKREFFLENAGIFEFGVPARGAPLFKAFFSRRIGIADGDVIPIDFGLRLTGRAGPWSFGILDVQTAELAPDSERDIEGAPSTNWGAIRFKRNIGQRSTVGMIATSRDAGGRDANRVLGFDVDLKPSDELSVSGFVIASDDTDPTIGDDWSGGVNAAWSGTVLDWDVGIQRIGDRFEPDAGFLLRQGVYRFASSADYEPRPDLPGIRNLSFEVDTQIITDLDGNTLTEEIEIEPFGLRLESEDRFGVFVEHNYERLTEPFEIVEGIVIPTGGYTFLEYGVRFGTNDSRRIAAFGGLRTGDFFNGKRTGARFSITIRPNRYVRAETNWQLNDVELPAGSFTTNVITERLGLALNPRLRADVLVQYNDFDEQVGVNLRVNWIYRPGADLFVVYNQNWMAPELSALQRQDRQLAVKFTYLWQR